MPALLQAAAMHSRGQLVTATPQALAGLAAGLAHWGYAPDESWQQELCVEAFAQMSGFGAQVRPAHFIMLWVVLVRLQCPCKRLLFLHGVGCRLLGVLFWWIVAVRSGPGSLGLCT
jgi:hypothetical protein